MEDTINVHKKPIVGFTEAIFYSNFWNLAFWKLNENSCYVAIDEKFPRELGYYWLNFAKKSIHLLPDEAWKAIHNAEELLVIYKIPKPEEKYTIFGRVEREKITTTELLPKDAKFVALWDSEETQLLRK